MNPFARIPPAPTPSHPLLDRLWARYALEVPHAATFAKLHALDEGTFTNDHIALRTLGHPGPGIAQFARVFERLGWKHGGDYVFDDVHLRAIHLSKPGAPRIFISELLPEALPVDARTVLLDLAIDATPAPGDSIDALASWFQAPRPPPASALDVVASASQYGAWLLSFGRKVNHFTAAVDDVELWQLRLLQHGVPMKSDIEGVVGGPLRQTATRAVLVDIALADGANRKVPYAYFELAERKRGFDGFLAPQARQLFDMTQSEPVAVVEDIAAPYATQRKFPRKDVAVAVDASWNDGRARIVLRSSNMSLGGVFLVFHDGNAPPIGTAMRLALDLPRGAVDVTGVVRWRMAGSGAGIELDWHPRDPARAAMRVFLDGID